LPEEEGGKSEPALRRFTNRPEDRGTAERALERTLLANKLIALLTMETSFSIITMVIHNLQRTAILKLSKLALCPSLKKESH
jgi:hypothetical protein